MGDLFQQIRDAVLARRYIIGVHAGNQLDERGIPDWQVVEGIAGGKVPRERPNDLPNPAVEVDQLQPDGTSVKAVWSYLVQFEVAKLVTVHYYDRRLMRLEGERVKRFRWIHAGELAVKVEVEAVIPTADPSEPCFEPDTVDFLRGVYEHAQAGDVEWLQRVGKVYRHVGV